MSTDNVKQPNGPRKQPNTGRSTGKDAASYGRRRRSTIAWGQLEPDAIGRWVARLCDAGYGIVLGKTSDGGALSVTILDGDDRYRDYPSSVEDFEDLSDWCENHYDLPSYGSTMEPTPKKPT